LYTPAILENVWRINQRSRGFGRSHSAPTHPAQIHIEARGDYDKHNWKSYTKSQPETKFENSF
jgi:hypothetical protein